MMHGHEKSDPEIVAIRTDAGGIRRERPANNAAPAAAELVERRAGDVVQKVLPPGYTENRQSRASRGIPGFECNPDLNHALRARRQLKSNPLGVASLTPQKHDPANLARRIR